MDAEMVALAEVYRILSELPPGAAFRVLDWVHDRMKHEQRLKLEA